MRLATCQFAGPSGDLIIFPCLGSGRRRFCKTVVIKMDEFLTREKLNELYRQDDECQRDFEAWQAKYERRKQQQSQRSQIVRKKYHPDALASVQSEVATLDDVSSAQWNAWAEYHVDVLRQEIRAWIKGHTDVNNRNTEQADKDIEKINANFERINKRFVDYKDWMRRQIAVSEYETVRRQVQEQNTDLIERISTLEEIVNQLQARVADLEQQNGTAGYLG